MELWCGWSKRWDLVRPRCEICVSTGREGSLGCEEGVNRSQKSVQEQLRSLRISYMFPFAARSQLAVVSDCDSVDCSPPSSYVHGVFQARILEWIAISSSRGIFPSQGSNCHLLCLLHWQADSFTTELPGKTFIPGYNLK